MKKIAVFVAIVGFSTASEGLRAAAPAAQPVASTVQIDATKFRDSLVRIFKTCDVATGYMIDVKGLGDLSKIIQSGQAMKKSCAEADRDIQVVAIPTTLEGQHSTMLPNTIRSCKISYSKKVIFASILEKIDSLHPAPEFMQKLNAEYQVWDIQGQICKGRLRTMFEDIGIKGDVFDREN